MQDALQGGDADAEEDDAEPAACQKKGQRRPQHILPAGDDGTPLIQMILDMQALEQKDIMRMFVTWHYHKSCLVPEHVIHSSAQAKHAASKMPVFLGLQLAQTLVSGYHPTICCSIVSSKSLHGSQARRLQ